RSRPPCSWACRRWSRRACRGATCGSGRCTPRRSGSRLGRARRAALRAGEPRRAYRRRKALPVSLAAQRRDWDELAELDPYWAVCTTRGTRFGGWNVDEFFATGEVEVAEILAAAEPLGVPRARGAALDFGCGLGRLTRALATRFDRTVGVDISPRMVDRARTLTPDPACEFRVNSSADLTGL